MRIRSRALSIFAAATLAAAGLTAAASTSANAAATSCRGGAQGYSSDPTYNYWPQGTTSWAVTTSNCNDINVKPNNGVYVKTCFMPSNGNYYCNSQRWIAAGTWGLAATDVLDNTSFYLQFDRASSGQVAY
jgi:hypothetical protein